LPVAQISAPATAARFGSMTLPRSSIFLLPGVWAKVDATRMAEVRITTAERQKIDGIDVNPFYEGNAEISDCVLEFLSEIEIRFQFQGKENNREGLDWSSLNLTM